MKNHEVFNAIQSLNSLKGLTLDGKYSLAIVILKKKLKSQLDIIQEAEKSVIENFCLKDDNGNPVNELKEDKGFQYFQYSFANPEDSKKCSIELDKIRNDDFYFDRSFTLKDIERVSCSVEQMEGLLLLSIE